MESKDELSVGGIQVEPVESEHRDMERLGVVG